MSFPNPVPVALCGKNPNMASSFSDALEKQGYKVVHASHDVSNAKSKLPTLLTSPDGPYAVVIGKGFSQSEMDDIVSHCRSSTSGRKVAWLLPDDEKITLGMKAKVALTAGTALPGMVADRAAECLKSRGCVPGGKVEAFEGGVCGF